MTTHSTATTKPSEYRLAAIRIIVAAIGLVAALGSAFLWWRTSHVDQNGRIPQPNIAVNVPCLLLQATALRNGLHCVCMTGYPKWKFAAQLERQTHIHEPGYARAQNFSFAGFRFAVLTRRLDDSDSILSPFGAVVFPYWFLVAVFSFAFLYLAARTCLRFHTKTLLYSAILWAILSSQSLATTGWDRHEVDIVSTYRIHGVNGASFVHRIDAKGHVIGPPLCGTLDATGTWNGLHSPPDYVVAGPRLFIRYPNLDAAIANHFSIHIDDGTIVGPLTGREFEQAFANPELKWRTPETVADQFHRALWIAGLLTSIVVAGLMLGLSLFVRRVIPAYRERGKRNPKPKLNIDALDRQIVK